MPYIVLAFLVILILFYSFKLLFIYLSAPKQQVTYLNPIFNKIPAPQVSNSSSSAGLKFALDTIEGVPVTATDSAEVFFLPQTATRFGYREKIFLMAKTFGFSTDSVNYQLTGTNAFFNDGKQKLTIDITNFNFNYQDDYQQDKALFASSQIPSQDQVQTDATNFLKTVGRYPDELTQGKTNVVYFSYNAETNNLYATQNLQEANVVEVDFYRPDIDAAPSAIPVVSPLYFNSQNHVIMIYPQGAYKVIKAQVAFFEKSTDQVGTYPLKSADVAYSELKSGQGLVVSGAAGRNTVSIQKMFLAYYDPDTYEPYLEPVYVFLGTNNFVAYVPAVSGDYLTP